MILIHGGFLGLGLTDDEAYYWVLAQKSALGYAYHPPAVAWWIAASQRIWSPLLGSHHEFVVRFPAALTSAVFLGLALKWLVRAGVPSSRLLGSGLILVSVAGLFSMAWMMVPDIPLFLAWTVALISTWEICFSESDDRAGLHYVILLVSTAVAILSKYSAVLGAISAMICVGLWAPRSRRTWAWGAVIGGGIAAAIPILIWNAQHEWAAILYQIRERHQGGDGVSLLRYARFWAVEVLIVGPVLIAFAFKLFSRAVFGARAVRFLLCWIIPGAAVFLVQPLFSDFKPHWALIVWWPLALAFAWHSGTTPAQDGGLATRAKIQIGYGLGLGAFVLLACHLPVGNFVLDRLKAGEVDPRLDVTNDLYGWKELRPFIIEKLGPNAFSLPVVGSRYQTASQAAFAIGVGGVGVLLPRSIRDRDEWPQLAAADGIGPAWPGLRSPVLFVADNRYAEGPQFVRSTCSKLGRVEKFRGKIIAKWIDVWRCEPDGAPPGSIAGFPRQSP